MLWDKITDFFTSASLYLAEHAETAILGVGFFLILWIFRKTWEKLAVKLLHKMLKPATEEHENAIVNAISGPARVFFPVLGFMIALWGIFPDSELTFMNKAFRIAVVFIVAWLCMNMTPIVVDMVMQKQTNSVGATGMSVKYLGVLIKVIIVVITVVIFINELGYDIDGIITGLGLGGLTVSLAAQNTMKNLFAGFEIVSDKPFDVGDYIKTPSCEGTVVDLSIRSTRIRSIDDVVVTVPNATLTAESIINWSRLRKRMYTETVGLTYDTPTETIRKIINEITNMLYAHDDVDKERIVVDFAEFAESSLNLEVIYYTADPNFDHSKQVREDINFRIHDIVTRNGASFAFPSTTVYMGNTEAKVAAGTDINLIEDPFDPFVHGMNDDDTFVTGDIPIGNQKVAELNRAKNREAFKNAPEKEPLAGQIAYEKAEETSD